MDPKQFEKSNSGRVVKISSNSQPYWAFIPNPLPPAISADWHLASSLSAADRSLSELSGLGHSFTNINLLVAPFIRSEAVLSSKIEGTQTGVVELLAYEAGQLVLPGMAGLVAPEADMQEVRNYVSALEYGLNEIRTRPTSLRLICDLHQVLLQKSYRRNARPGCFREVQNYIGQDGAPIVDATYGPPPVSELSRLLDNFEKYIHNEDEYPPLVRLAILHYQFEAIHPFGDGNGRLGRLLNTLLLLEWGLLEFPILNLSAYFEGNRQQYYELLLNTSKTGDWQPWIKFFLHGVREQSSDAIMKVKQLHNLRDAWRDIVTQGRSSSTLVKLVDLLFETPIISVSHAEKRLEVSNRTARLSVERLVGAGILRQIGDSDYARLYAAEGILNILIRQNQEAAN